MYRRIIEELMRIEGAVDVNALREGGLCVWPLARFRISRALQYGALDGGSAPAGTQGKLAKLSLLLSSMGKGTGQLRGKGPVDAVVLEAPDFSREPTDLGNFDKTADSMLELLKAEGFSALKLGAFPGQHLNEVYPVMRVSPLLDKLRLRLLGSGAKAQIDSLIAEVRQISGGKISLPPDFLESDVYAVRVFESLFHRCFRELRPRAVFVSTYYANVQAMGAILAARSLGIVSVDIQHGSQGPDHEMYTHWSKLPPDGYELLPDFFWSWGEESASHIRKLRPEGYRHHEPVVGGNLWLAKCVSGELQSPLIRKAAPFFDYLLGAEKVVLFAMQPIRGCLPENILEAIKLAPKRWIWLIRLHPQMKADVTTIREKFAAAGIGNFEIDFSTDLPLYHVLSRADHLVTIFSSSVTEAAVLGIPSTLTDEVGRDHYPTLVAAGQAVFADTPDRIVASISEGKKGVKPGRPYMELDPAVARAALARIMSGSGK